MYVTNFTFLEGIETATGFCSSRNLRMYMIRMYVCDKFHFFWGIEMGGGFVPRHREYKILSGSLLRALKMTVKRTNFKNSNIFDNFLFTSIYLYNQDWTQIRTTKSCRRATREQQIQNIYIIFCFLKMTVMKRSKF